MVRFPFFITMSKKGDGFLYVRTYVSTHVRYFFPKFLSQVQHIRPLFLFFSSVHLCVIIFWGVPFLFYYVSQRSNIRYTCAWQANKCLLLDEIVEFRVRNCQNARGERDQSFEGPKFWFENLMKILQFKNLSSLLLRMCYNNCGSNIIF